MLVYVLRHFSVVEGAHASEAPLAQQGRELFETFQHHD
jgi:hypothetical protein